MKLPLDHTDDDISINMGSGRKGGRSWKHNRYNRYNKYKRYIYNRYTKLNRYSPSVLTMTPRTTR